MWLGQVYYERKDAPEDNKYVRIGNLWWEPDSASILLKGFHKGMWLCRPYPKVKDAPYIEGDLKVCTGEYDDGGQRMKKEYIWCGHMGSNQSESGQVMYWGVLEVLPLVPLRERGGIWIKVFQP